MFFGTAVRPAQPQSVISIYIHLLRMNHCFYKFSKHLIILKSIYWYTHLCGEVGLRFCQSRIIRFCHFILIPSVSTILYSIQSLKFFDTSAKLYTWTLCGHVGMSCLQRLPDCLRLYVLVGASHTLLVSHLILPPWGRQDNLSAFFVGVSCHIASPIGLQYVSPIKRKSSHLLPFFF